MSRAKHVADRTGVVHRCVGEDVPEADSVAVACGGWIVFPGNRVAGPATCVWCKAGQVEPGWES